MANQYTCTMVFFTTVFFFFIKTNVWKPKLYLGKENSQKMISLVCCILERLKPCFEKKKCYENREK